VAVDHPVGLNIAVQAIFNSGGSFIDITADVRSMELRTCRRANEGLIFEPGSLSLVLDNSARKYDPLYSSGTYFGQLKPGRQVRVYLDSASAGQTPVWRGWVDRFYLNYDRSNNDSTVTITCIDALSIASLGALPAGTSPGLTAGENVTARLAQIDAVSNVSTGFGWPSWANNSTDYVAECAGQSESVWDNTQSYNTLDLCRRAASLEQGPLTASFTSNEVLVWPRHWWKLYSESNTVQTTIGTGGLPFHDIRRVFDADEIITTATMVSDDGATATATDAAAVAIYGYRHPSASYDRIPARNSEQLEGAANTVVGVNSTEYDRVDEIVVKPGSASGWQQYAVELTLMSRIALEYTPTSTGSAISADYFIDGITHEVSPGDWTTTYSLMPADRFDDAISGSLFIVGTSLVDGTHQVGF
jgi:hypothetical protein